LFTHYRKKTSYLFIVIISLINQSATSQLIIKGTVYDSTGVFPLPFVSVITNSGNGTTTDKNGNYKLDVNNNDSIWFSYLNKPTRKYSVSSVNDLSQFNVSLYVGVPVLKEVKIEPHNYRLDSIQNRIDYAKAFNYQKPTFKSVVPAFGIPFIVVDLDELIRVFQYQKKRNALSFQRRLIQEEKDKFIDNRFSKGLVLRLTDLIGEARDSFMLRYRPTYEFTKKANDYDFYFFIKKSFLKFIQDSSFNKKPQTANLSLQDF
jgi:hypothetical protein